MKILVANRLHIDHEPPALSPDTLESGQLRARLATRRHASDYTGTYSFEGTPMDIPIALIIHPERLS